MKQQFPDSKKLIYQRDFPGKDDTKGKKYTEEDQDYLLAASLTDCTGLIPAAPKTEYEIESYEQIQHFLPPSYPCKEEDDESMKI